jgi:hypothetical protein
VSDAHLELFDPPPAGGFADFWSAWPRKDDKQDAEKAWLQVTQGKNKAPPSVIIAGARRYAELMKGTERRYVKLPATWLRGRCWENESLKPKADRVADTREMIEAEFNAKWRWERGPNGMRKVPVNAR